jgi:fission 1 protein
MGETKTTQKEAKKDLDRKLSLSTPSRSLLEELAITCAKDSSPNATFQYAFALSKSTEPSELRYAVSILDGLVKEGYEHQVDCMYGAATALYLLGDYRESRVRTLYCPRCWRLYFVFLVRLDSSRLAYLPAIHQHHRHHD